MAPLIDETCSSGNYNIDVDIDNMSLSSHHSEEVQQVIMMNTTKFPSSVPQHTSVTSSKYNVHFSDDTTTTRLVLSRADYTMEEVTATWYNRTDLKQMRDTARCEAKLLAAGLLQETMHTSARGLEARTSEGLKRKRSNRTNATTALFDELDQQDEQGVFDDDALADVYFIYTEHCQVAAQMMGMRDAKLAMEVLKQTEKQIPLHSVTLLPSNFVNGLSTPERLISSAA
jgi:hypothetical protein